MNPLQIRAKLVFIVTCLAMLASTVYVVSTVVYAALSAIPTRKIWQDPERLHVASQSLAFALAITLVMFMAMGFGPRARHIQGWNRFFEVQPALTLMILLVPAMALLLALGPYAPVWLTLLIGIGFPAILAETFRRHSVPERFSIS